MIKLFSGDADNNAKGKGRVIIMDMTITNINSAGAGAHQPASVNQGEGGQAPARARPDAAEVVNTVNHQSLEEVKRKIEDSIANSNISIDFSRYGDKSEKISITVKERESGKVIREIPAEEVQHMQLKMEELVGVLFNDTI